MKPLSVSLVTACAFVLPASAQEAPEDLGAPKLMFEIERETGDEETQSLVFAAFERRSRTEDQTTSPEATETTRVGDPTRTVRYLTAEEWARLQSQSHEADRDATEAPQ